MNDWAATNPVFVDFETQSAADIKEIGGRLYALHPSTRVLILAMFAGDNYHVWIPDYIRVPTTHWADGSLWPNELKPKLPVRLYRGSTLPPAMAAFAASGPLVAHNAYGFDRYVWERCCNVRPAGGWLDSLYLSRIGNLPGRLDALGKALIGTGKDRAAKLMPLLTSGKPDPWGDGWCYPIIKPGDLQAFTRYAVGDVEILRRVWDDFAELEVEADVIETHNRVNARGIQVDVPLLRTIKDVSEYSVETAADDIAEMTGGAIPPDKLRSTKVVHGWLESHGVRITDESKLDKDGKAKQSLRKEVVQRFLDSPFVIEENLLAVREIPPVVIDVLKLRLKALRITDAKVNRALQRVEADKRIYDLMSYHIASTGRFSSSGMQIHNLPRPIKGLDIQGLIKLLSAKSNDAKKTFAKIKTFLAEQKKSGAIKDNISVDDVCSTLIRPTIVAKKGHVFILNDWSAIEARGIAGIAEEWKLLNLFKAHGDPYKQFAARVYNKPESEVNDDERQVGKVGILGLGYGMGAAKLRIFAANSGVDLVKAGVTADIMVDLYRDTYTQIAGWKPQRENKQATYRVGGVWKDLNKTVMETVEKRTVNYAGKCTFSMRADVLCCQLPSGRTLHYPQARIEDVIPPYVYTLNLPPVPKATCLYTSPRGPKSLFGGLIAENIVQAISRDVMACSLVKLDRMGFNPVLHVHDEIVCEVPIAKADRMLIQMAEIMSTPPEWAEGWFPLEVEGFVSPRFVKKAWEGYAKVESKKFAKIKA